MNDINGELLEAVFNKKLNNVTTFKSIQHYKERILLCIFYYVFGIAVLTVFFALGYLSIFHPVFMAISSIAGVFYTIGIIIDINDIKKKFNNAMSYRISLSMNETKILDDTFSVFSEYRHISLSKANMTLSQFRDIINAYYTVQNAKLETYQMFSKIN